MGRVNASVELVGLEALQRRFRKANSDLPGELVDAMFVSTRPLVRDMHGSATSRIERRAVSTVEVRRDQKGVELTGGEGHALGAALFMGGEFGGRVTRKKLVRARVFGGPPVWVKKRTTMQFKPHLGKEGYFFWPAVRDWLPKVHRDVGERAAEVLGDGR